MAERGRCQPGFFHLYARHRKHKNFIARLCTAGQIATTHDDKAEVLLDFYSNLIGSREKRECTIDLDILGIPRHNLDMIDAPISEEEVWNTIKQLPSDKAQAWMDSPVVFTKHVGSSSKVTLCAPFQQYGGETSGISGF